MNEPSHTLAIETSSRAGSVALGCGDRLLGEADLPLPRRHRVELMPAIDQLCARHGVGPADLGEVAVCLGPGSFTGLRIAVTTAKMLAMTLGVKVVAAPAAQVIAAGVDVGVAPHLAVCLARQQDSFYCAMFDRIDDQWQLRGEPGIETDPQLPQAPRPLAVAGEGRADMATSDQVVLIDATPRAADLWRIARGRSAIDPLTLAPLYARVPQAQQQWDERYGKGATIQSRPESC